MKTKSLKLTSKTSHEIPVSAFTEKDYLKVNPSVKKSTAYQRLKVLEKDGVIVVAGEVRQDTTKRGRASIVYKLPDASDDSNLMHKVVSQGRIKVATVGTNTDTAVTTDTPAETVSETVAATEDVTVTTTAN